MRKLFNALFFDSLFTQSILMFASSVFVNIFNLIFWLYMVRKLTPEDYGILNALTAVFMFLSVPVAILGTVVTRYVSKFMAHQKEPQVKFLLFNLTKMIGFFLLGLVIVLVLAGRSIIGFLHITELRLLYIVCLGLFFTSFSSLTVGALAGLQKFKEVAFNNAFSGFLKLIFAFILVAAGFKVFGALLGFAFSIAFGFILSVTQLPGWLKDLKSSWTHGTFDFKEIYAYFLPAGLCTLCFFALTNMDVVLVKHFFSPLDAGYYSVAQMVGKIVLFVPTAVGVVMFPKIVDSHAKNGNTKALLKKCLLAVTVLCGSAAFFSLLFPEFILKALTRHTQPQTVALVKFFALSMGFFALVNIFMLYNLSLHRMRYIYQLAALTGLELIGICIFHASLSQVLLNLTFTSAALLCLGILSVERGGAH